MFNPSVAINGKHHQQSLDPCGLDLYRWPRFAEARQRLEEKKAEDAASAAWFACFAKNVWKMGMFICFSMFFLLFPQWWVMRNSPKKIENSFIPTIVLGFLLWGVALTAKVSGRHWYPICLGHPTYSHKWIFNGGSLYSIATSVLVENPI